MELIFTWELNTLRKEEYFLYLNALKRIIDRHYEKEMVFYEDPHWYSRYHCKKITPKELCDFALEITDFN